jgi:hypothetical protein
MGVDGTAPSGWKDASYAFKPPAHPKRTSDYVDDDSASSISSEGGGLEDNALTHEQHRLVDFFFQQRRGELDARRIGRVDVDAMIADVDLETLCSLVDNIAFCHMDEVGMSL